MKRFLILLSLLFCNTVCAETINLHWLNEDGSTYQNSTCVIDSDLILPSTPPTKYGYTFTGWKFASYRPIEYLESTGTQWIDTGYVPNQDTGVKARFYLTTVNNGEALILGSGMSDRVNTYELYLTNQKIEFDYYDGYVFSDNTVKTGDDIVIDWNKNVIKYSINGINQNNINKTYGYFVAPYNMRIFSIARPTNVTNPVLLGKVRVYYTKIYDNNTLVRDFIPVLDSDGIPCMYDKVTEQFFYNRGTGNFIAGPVL